MGHQIYWNFLKLFKPHKSIRNVEVLFSLLCVDLDCDMDFLLEILSWGLH